MKIEKITLLAAPFAAGLLTAGCNAKKSIQGAKTAAAGAGADRKEDTAARMEENEAASKEEVSDQETGRQIEVVRQGMEPIYGNEIRNGVYPMKVDSSSLKKAKR